LHWMQTRCSTGDEGGAAGLFFSSGRAISEASMMAAFYHGESAARWNAVASILEHAPGI
jgi:hypothetical protein